MENADILFKKVKNSFDEKEFNKFHVHHYFTLYKLKSAKFFQEELEKIERTEPGGIAGISHKEARIYVDCEYYMLIGVYDGLFQVINSVLDLKIPQCSNFRLDVLKALKKEENYQEIWDKLNEEWKSWVKNLGEERNDYTHIKYRGRQIVKNMWDEKTRVYDIYDKFKKDKEELVKKLRGYYQNMYSLVGGIYGLIINRL